MHEEGWTLSLYSVQACRTKMCNFSWIAVQCWNGTVSINLEKLTCWVFFVFLFVFLDHPFKCDSQYSWEMTHGVSNQTGSELYPSSHDILQYNRFQIIFKPFLDEWGCVALLDSTALSSKLCFRLFLSFLAFQLILFHPGSKLVTFTLFYFNIRRLFFFYC